MERSKLKLFFLANHHIKKEVEKVLCLEFEGDITVDKDAFFKKYLEIFNANRSYYCSGEVKVMNLPDAAYRCYDETSYVDIPGDPKLEKRHRDRLYSQLNCGGKGSFKTRW